MAAWFAGRGKNGTTALRHGCLLIARVNGLMASRADGVGSLRGARCSLDRRYGRAGVGSLHLWSGRLHPASGPAACKSHRDADASEDQHEGGRQTYGQCCISALEQAPACMRPQRTAYRNAAAGEGPVCTLDARKRRGCRAGLCVAEMRQPLSLPGAASLERLPTVSAWAGSAGGSATEARQVSAHWRLAAAGLPAVPGLPPPADPWHGRPGRAGCGS